MSVGPLGFISSAAATPLSAKAGDIEKAQRNGADQQRRVQFDRSAADAAGIARTDGEQHQSSERDADGRLPWQQAALEPEGEQQEPATERATSLPAGQTGNLLDLTG